ncbi:MAG: glycosyltransferase WbuB [Actinobacteria bacterium HGW-Actinobacteria-10]|nr:MAG: glycosyltransferase WbuB [Actinobacteria bacterium HGW-Actinobacteria-10]
MRIAYLHQYFRTPEMGGGTRSFEMGKRLAARGHVIHMITADCAPKPGAPKWRVEQIGGMTIHWTPVRYENKMRLPARMVAFLLFAVRAASRTASIAPDVIFATSTPLTIAIPAIMAKRRTGAPMVLEVRDLWPDVPIALNALRDPISRAMARWLEMIAYRSSARIVALAPGMRDDIIAKRIPAERLTVIPNGADLDIFGPDVTRTEKLRESTPWLGSRPMVLYAGTIGIVNSVDYLVQVAAATWPLDSEIRFVVAGTGREEQRVRDLAARLGVLDRNFFMLGEMSKSLVAEWLSAATMSIALLTGPRIVWKDAVSNKFFDALAAGCPVANNFDGYSSQVACEAGAGIIIDANDQAVAAAQLVRHLRDEDWLTSAGAASLALGRGQFSRDRLAGELEEVLLEVAVQDGGLKHGDSTLYQESA